MRRGTHKINVGFVGYGYWGPNLARNVFENQSTELAAIADKNPKRREARQPEGNPCLSFDGTRRRHLRPSPCQLDVSGEDPQEHP